MPQQLLFELNGARVAPDIATFGGTSYQVANIGSVRVERRKKSNPVTIIIFLLGLGILAVAIVNSRMTGAAEAYFSMAVTGVAVIVAAFFRSTHLAWARLCSSFENIQWRRGRRCVTQQGVCFQRSESC